MGLVADVFRSVKRRNEDGSVVQQDCTLLGWSSKYDRVCIINVDGPFEPKDDCPAVMLVKHRTLNAVHLVSVADLEAKNWTMMGGNFVHTCDSRLREAIEKLISVPFHGPVACHDRVE